MKKKLSKVVRTPQKKPTVRFKILLDTCVWLDLIKDRESQHVIATLEELVHKGIVQILLPRIILEEFDRHKDRMIMEASRGLAGHLKIAREVVAKLADPNNRFHNSWSSHTSKSILRPLRFANSFHFWTKESHFSRPDFLLDFLVLLYFPSLREKGMQTMYRTNSGRFLNACLKESSICVQTLLELVNLDCQPHSLLSGNLQ